MWLIDTNVVSELTRARPYQPVVDWLKEQDPSKICTSVIVIGEIRKGIAQLPVSDLRRERLERWLKGLIDEHFAGRLRPVDLDIALRWGSLVGAARQKGIAVPVADGLIAATALVYGDTIVTRDEKEFTRLGVSVVNPWMAQR
ncbi:MAG: type II toxin-antitoxin system VapC family toxin [Rhodospirillaceae bacterium]|nr:type II toxin-antitoxin system VapC family toxin [Rhodospirillaceae bacterium]